MYNQIPGVETERKDPHQTLTLLKVPKRQVRPSTADNPIIPYIQAGEMGPKMTAFGLLPTRRSKLLFNLSSPSIPQLNNRNILVIIIRLQ